MPLRRSQIIIISVAAGIILFFVLVYFRIIPGLRKPEPPVPAALTFWGVGDDFSAFSGVISDYQLTHPNVQIHYRQLRESEYERELVNALAANQPVDIVMFRNSWLPKHFDKILPLPTETLAEAGRSFTFTDFQNLFPTVAIQDFAPDQTIYALPLYLDTLALIYNRDTFDSRGIALPPRNWKEFQDVVAKLNADLTVSASTPKPGVAAIGGSNRTIAHATDLLNLLFLQSGAPLVDASFSRADFSTQGQSTLTFYTQFTDPRSDYYAWPPAATVYSLDSFADGGTAIIFGYQDQLEEIRARNPYVPLMVASMPQPLASTQAVNWARYYGLAVSRTSANPLAAWDFILFLAADPAQSSKYLQGRRSPALRSLIEQAANDPELRVFARQALSARSYPQVDDSAIERIFSTMIESVVYGRESAYSAIVKAEAEITQLIQRRKR